MKGLEFRGKRVTVLGLARSGLASALALKKCGAVVFGSDSGAPAGEVLAALSAGGIAFETGGHTEKMLDADLFVISPGVPLSSPAVKSAQKKGVPLIGEIELAYRLTGAFIVAVTGSNGKSTTATLISELLKKGPFRVRLGGNIGSALTRMGEGLEGGDCLVAEISSFQLDTAATFRPRVAVVLNLTPNHMDRYASQDDYYLSKLSITKNQDATDILVLNADDANTRRLKGGIAIRARQYAFSMEQEPERGAFVRQGSIFFRDQGGESEVLPVSRLALPGRHNLGNALAAVSAAGALGIPAKDMAPVLEAFRGIEHRIEFVREIRGVRFYNDSKATTVDSLRVALLALNGKVNLIAGGRDKKADFTVIRGLVGERAKAVFTVGEAAEKIEKAWQGATPLFREKSMEEAVKAAYRNSEKGESVLLSPACASFDMYGNFEERGRHFKRIVEAL